jgi:hypothetical protein
VAVSSVAPNEREMPVYNLSVAEVPEYFANGVLVHNCRYALMAAAQRTKAARWITLPSGRKILGR